MAKILIADDSDAIRLVLKDILGIGEHEVIAEAIDGQESIDLYKETKPDLILLDLAMPKKVFSKRSQLIRHLPWRTLN
ncbi:MAG: response regulator [Nitrosopumilus sp.]